MDDHQPIPFCHFCSRSPTEVSVLVTAPDQSAAICDDCLGIAIAIVRVLREDRLTAMAQAKAAAEAEAAWWVERGANPEWQKGLHDFFERNTDH